MHTRIASAARSMFLLPLALAPAALGQSVSIPFPHPLITEVLAAVPSGPRGDASGDGLRDAVGDEFIELVNPHDKPIQLKGYTLVDADGWSPGAPKPGPAKPAAPPPTAPTPTDKPHDPGTESSRAELRFVFPDCELKPGQVVVVFNGYNQKITGPVGDALKAPAGGNDKFHEALVFSMKNESPYAALSNEADFVLLVAPDGKPVHVVRWGKAAKNPPKDALLNEPAPPSIGSVQRDGVRGSLVAHRDLKGDLAGANFSPGVFSMTPGVDPPASPSIRPPSTPRSGAPRTNQPRPNNSRP